MDNKIDEIKGDSVIGFSGIDTISFFKQFKSLQNTLLKLGIEITPIKRGSPLNEIVRNRKKSYLKDKKEYLKKHNLYKKELLPRYYQVKLTSGRGLSNYALIETFTIETINKDIKAKKGKGTYCKIIFNGLHQPTKKITKELMLILQHLFKSKTLKVDTIDLSYDIKQDIKECLKLKHSNIVSKKRYNQNYKGTLFLNAPINQKLSKIKIYHKYNKQSKHHKQILDSSLKEWVRCEVTINVNHTKLSFNDLVTSEYFKHVTQEIKEGIISKVYDGYIDDTYMSLQIHTIKNSRNLNKENLTDIFNSKAILRDFKRDNKIKNKVYFKHSLKDEYRY